MTVCHLWDTPDVELYFYEELGAADMARVAAHLRGCAECRQRLDDLRALGRLLARPRVEAPPAGDWSGFMRRLDVACDLEADAPVTTARRGLHRVAAIAAMLTVVTIGLIVASRVGPQAPAPARAVASVVPPGRTTARSERAGTDPGCCDDCVARSRARGNERRASRAIKARGTGSGDARSATHIARRLAVRAQACRIVVVGYQTLSAGRGRPRHEGSCRRDGRSGNGAVADLIERSRGSQIARACAAADYQARPDGEDAGRRLRGDLTV